MKKLFILSVLALMGVAQTFAQSAQKPTIMIVPEKAFCIKNGYVMDTNPKAIDVEKALLNDELLNTITEFGTLMADRDYPLVTLRQALDELAQEAAVDIAATSKEEGDITVDDYDQLARVAQADIMIQISMERVQSGPYKRIQFRVTGIDSASGKQITGETGTSGNTTAPANLVVKDVVNNFMDHFCDQLSRHFSSMNANGREGSVMFKIADDCPLKMDSEVTFNGDTGELNELLDYWMNENTVNGSYTAGRRSKVSCGFNQVRFPLFGKAKFGGKQTALDMEKFLKNNKLPEFLSSLGISCSFLPQGIGKCTVVLGGK